MPGIPLAALVASLVSIGIGQSLLFAVLPPAARELGVSPFQIATIFAASATIWVFASPWWGRRSDRVGRRPVILAGLLGYALSMALVATTLLAGMAGMLPAALVYPALIGSRCVFAVLGSGTGPAAHGWVADHTTPAQRAAAIALLGAGMGIGETIGPGIGAALTRLGLATPIYLASALAAGSAVLVRASLAAGAAGAGGATRARPPMHVSDRRVLPFVIVGTALQAVRATTVITLALYLQDTLTLTAAQAARHAGAAFVALAVASLVAQLVLVQRLAPAPSRMIRAGLPLVAVAFVVVVVGRSFAPALVAMVMLGLGLGLVRPGLSAAVSLAVTRDEQGAAAGLLTGVAVVGNVVGPLVGTTLYRWAPAAPFVLNAAVMLPVVVFALASRRIGQARAADASGAVAPARRRA